MMMEREFDRASAAASNRNVAESERVQSQL
jgi:hypothetical protein